MKHALSILAVLVTGFCGLAQADPPAGPAPLNAKPSPTQQAPASDPDSILTNRQITFVLSDEEQLLTFQPGIPALLDQRFVVDFHVILNFPREEKSFVEESREAATEIKLLLSNELPKSFVHYSLSSTGWNWTSFDRIPQNQLPSPTVLANLSKQREFDEFNAGISNWGNRDGRLEFGVRLLATDREQAELLARAMLTSVDYGMIRPFQQRCREAANYLDGRLRENRARLDNINKELPLLGKQRDGLKEFALSTAESRANLSVQTQMIAVEVASLQARIEACNKILKQGSLNPSRIDQVETIKTSAEIELVGLAAKRDALDQILNRSLDRSRLDFQIGALSREASHLRPRIEAAERKLAALKAVGDPKQFFGEIAGYEHKKTLPGKILIRKIKWTEPKPATPPPQR